MMIRYAPNNFINQWLAQFRIVKESVSIFLFYNLSNLGQYRPV